MDYIYAAFCLSNSSLFITTFSSDYSLYPEIKVIWLLNYIDIKVLKLK